MRDWFGPLSNGYEYKAWHAMGYGGWQLGPCRIGRRDDGAIVVISSGVVGKPLYLPDLEDARCTRLDIRIDCYYEGDRPQLALLANDATLAYRKGRGGRPYLVDLRAPDPGSSTLYIGRRTSPLFVRVYDKEEESGNDPAYRGCWRLEVELKDEAANETFHALRAVAFSEDRQTACCLAYCAERGLLFSDWKYDRWDAFKAGPGVVTDCARKLNWLATSVAPSVRWLLRNSDIGSIVTALGLQAYVKVKEDYDGWTDSERWKLPLSGPERADALVQEVRRRTLGGPSGSNAGGRGDAVE